jgi:hypothetical protein
LVDDVLECFGDLNSILSLLGGDKVECMAYVGRGKLGRATSRDCLELRTMFRAKPRDGTKADTSGG